MVNKKYIPPTTLNMGKRVAVEKHLLEKHYSFLKVTLYGESLGCTGRCQPSEHSPIYTYNLTYTPNKPPKVIVISPELPYNSKVHMYSDKSLCLYYPKDYNWIPASSHLYDTIVPWTHEWFVFYELYQLTGEWKHPFVNHHKI
ncbi:MAG: hypothetical protein V4717_14625 [Bacteroidota bacterium]